MLRVQLVGMPLRVHRRLSVELGDFASRLRPEILLRLVPSSSQSLPDIGRPELEVVRQNIQEGYTHIAVVPSRAQKEVLREFRFDCRVILLDLPGDFIRLPWDVFENCLRVAFDFELRWCDAIRPSDVRSPLLLPEVSFVPEREVVDFWRHCDCYRDASRLTRANNLLQAVRGAHRRSKAGVGAYWVDAGRRQFIVDPSYHATSREERRGLLRFRFCYQVPAGFHYDVTHELGERFSIRGRGEFHDRVLRVNADPWGSIRVK